MLLRSEILFAEEFISAIKKLGFNSIPFAGRAFNEGVSKLSSFIEENEESTTELKEVSIIFTPTPISGDYDRFIEALQGLNGRCLSFPLLNPSLQVALIDTPEEVAEQILERKSSNIPSEITMKAAEIFCAGAHITP